MKALITAVALLTFVAGTALSTESYAQTAATGQTMIPDTSTSTAPPTTTTPTMKRRHSSKSTHHAKKKSKKSSTAQSSSAKQRHTRHTIT